MIKDVKDLKNWVEITRGLYRYVVSAKVCYEIHILYWDKLNDISVAKASAYIVGEWRDKNKHNLFERECLVAEKSVARCLEIIEADVIANSM